MSSRIGLVSAVVVFGCLSIAQAQVVDQPQNAYAIITPVSGDPVGLVLTETLTNTGLGELGQTQVPPSPPMTKGALNVNIGTANEDSTGIAIVNPSTNVALVNLLLTDPQGIGILTQTFAIPPRRQISSFLSELFAGQIEPTTSSVGLLTITADVPVAILALNFGPFGLTAVQVVNLSSPVIPLTGATVVTIPAAPTSIPTTITSIPTTVTSIPTTITSIPNTFISIPPPFPTTSIITVQPTLTGTGTISFGTVPIVTTPVSKTPFLLTGTFAAQTSQTVLATSTLTFDTLVGPGAFIFPQVVSGGGWFTEITISNTSLTLQIVRIEVFDPNGALLNTLVSSVLPLGLVTFSSTTGGATLVAR
jgi:hypothetical protein